MSNLYKKLLVSTYNDFINQIYEEIEITIDNYLLTHSKLKKSDKEWLIHYKIEEYLQRKYKYHINFRRKINE